MPDDELATKLDYYTAKVKKATILKRNELESYLILPKVWIRALSNQGIGLSQTEFDEIVHTIKSSMEIDLETKFEQSYAKLKEVPIGDPETRTKAKAIFREMLNEDHFAVLPGKEVCRQIRMHIREKHSVTVSDRALLENMQISDLPSELKTLLRSILAFAKGENKKGD